MATAGGDGGEPDGGEPDERGRTRPTFLTVEAKAVLVVWLAVTLILVVVYLIVLFVG